MLDGANILAVGAHPDDLEYGCLGTLLKYGKKGRVVTYIASLGTAGDPTASLDRAAESQRALAGLAPVESLCRRKIGIQPTDYQELVSDLEGLLRRHPIDVILTLGPKDTHQEHRIVFETVLTAARRNNASILIYGILSNTPQFTPTVFVDITEQYQAKLEALRCHESQRDKYYMSQEYFDIFHSHNYASLHGKRHVECFEVFRFFF